MSYQQMWTCASTWLAVVAYAVSSATVDQGFKSSVTVVRTDVSVIDNRTGRPVTGLERSDFTVKEDGVIQDISAFVAEEGTPQGGHPGRPGAPRRSWLFILSHNNVFAVAEPYRRLAAFLRSSLRTDDQAAVLVANRVTAFTSDGEKLAALVERAAQMPMDLQTKMRTSRASGITPDIEAGIDSWLNPGGVGNFLRHTAPMIAGSANYAEMSDRWGPRIAATPVGQLTAGIQHLHQEPGERRIVMVALYGVSAPYKINGIPNIDNEREEALLNLQLVDAEVALDLVHTNGTTGAHGATMSGANLSRLSGGHFTSVRAIDEQLSRIDEASRFGYVIGYGPSSPKLDGKYRRLSISVNRKDVSVSYRRGYIAGRDKSANRLASHSDKDTPQ